MKLSRRANFIPRPNCNQGLLAIEGVTISWDKRGGVRFLFWPSFNQFGMAQSHSDL
jgi:hypothetical protein